MGKRKNSQKQGSAFEKAFMDFLAVFLPECFSFKIFITKPEIQTPGFQYGRDVNAKWNHKGSDYDWWFECKSHLLNKGSKSLGKKEVADKILDILTCQKPPSCYCIVAANKEMGNWLKDMLPRVNALGKTQFFVWSPNNLNLKECVALYPSIWSRIYGRKKRPTVNKDRKELHKRAREEFAKHNSMGLKNLETRLEVKDSNPKSVEVKITNEKAARELESVLKQIQTKYGKAN